MKTLASKVSDAYKFIGDLPREGLYVGHSGGKDSSVVLHLTEKLFRQIRVVHNPKSSIPIEDRQFIYELAMQRRVELVPVEEMEGSGLYLCQLDGSRRAEAARTDGKSTVFMEAGQEISRTEMKPVVEKGRFGIAMAYPIMDWTDEDVWEYIRVNQIKVSASYDQTVRNFGSAR